MRAADRISVDLRLLTARRTDLICDRVRSINRATLLEYFPALERAFDYSKKAPVILLGGYQTPRGHPADRPELARGWLKKRGCRNSAKMAEKALKAANSQHTVLPTQTTGSALVIRLAEQISTLDAEIADVDAQITDLFRQHDSADILLTMPGFGPILAATVLANIGGNLEAFDSVDRLASVADLAPVPRDSGRISGNLHRPLRFNCRLLRTCYLAALSSLKNSPASRIYYGRKRGEGKSHKQALIALARRRINVLWAMLRDHAIYQEPMPGISAQAA